MARVGPPGLVSRLQSGPSLDQVHERIEPSLFVGAAGVEGTVATDNTRLQDFANPGAVVVGSPVFRSRRFGRPGCRGWCCVAWRCSRFAMVFQIQFVVTDSGQAAALPGGSAPVYCSIFPDNLVYGVVNRRNGVGGAVASLWSSGHYIAS